MNNTILIVDDEPNIVELARLYLRNEGFAVESAANGLEALDKARSLQPKLVLLDIMMPELDGIEVCRQLRKESDIPVVMLTARGSDVDKIVGLELGADDYIAKPFNPREMVARVKAVLRRTKRESAPAKRIEIGNLEIDVLGREVTVAGSFVPLRAKEFDLLVALAENQGIAMARERLLHLVWGEDYFGDTRTLDVHVAWLRDKTAGSNARIATVWGFGYKLVSDEPA
jgi:DNA-binding response OmpR family regulator